MRILSRIKSRLIRIAGPLGLYALARQLTLHEPRILMYHRFGELDSANRLSGETFRHQLRTLKKHFCLITLADLAEQIKSGSVEPGQVVITVDDGYRDFCDIAFPILQEEGVPATFFVTTGFIDGQIWLWPDLLEYALEHTNRDELDLIAYGAARTASLDNEAGRRDAWDVLVKYLLDRTIENRSQELQKICDSLTVTCPDSPTSGYQAVNWDEIRVISEAGIEIGAHTVNHPRLTCLSDSELQSEIAGSKSRIEEKLGKKIRTFCYPNGAPKDYDARVAAAVEDAGFDCAVAAHFDGQSGDLYQLRRLGIGASPFQFEKSIYGVEHLGRRPSGTAT